MLTYTYDVENRLVGRTSTGASPAVTLAYDPLGRLWRVQGAAGTTRFLYDGDALAIETDGAGGVLRAFAHGPGSDEPVVWYEVPGGWRRLYPRADHQGSIVAASGDDGTLALINRYDEYGIPAATNTGRFQYTGQIWLPELGMYHYKARIYSPTLGRFLQTDPIGYADQFNLYEYVGDDPVNRSDPSGEQEVFGAFVPPVHYTPQEQSAFWNGARGFVGNVLEATADVLNSLPEGHLAAEPLAILGGIVRGTRAEAQVERVVTAAERRAANLEAGVRPSRIGGSGNVRPGPVVPSSHRSRALDRAQSQTARGQAAVEHRNPTVGDPHAHPVGANGKPPPGAPHFTYPRRGYPRNRPSNE